MDDSYQAMDKDGNVKGLAGRRSTTGFGRDTRTSGAGSSQASFFSQATGALSSEVADLRSRINGIQSVLDGDQAGLAHLKGALIKVLKDFIESKKANGRRFGSLGKFVQEAANKTLSAIPGRDVNAEVAVAVNLDQAIFNAQSKDEIYQIVDGASNDRIRTKMIDHLRKASDREFIGLGLGNTNTGLAGGSNMGYGT